jgi:hypothetical protein
MTLRRRLADFGFESNDDFEFPIRALFAARVEHLRCLHVDGESGRRKTAFANALARALDYARIVYHDFTTPEPPPAPIVISGEDKEKAEPIEAPLSAFERAVTEACAYSEAERAILILDQMQAADFRDQTRLYHFVRTTEWPAAQGQVKANAKNLLVVLVSEEALYHSLAKVSYRVWTDATGGRFEYRPEEFGLGQDARELFAALGALFDALQSTPTPTELRHIVDDLLHQVRTEDQLRHTVFGWMERVDRPCLYSAALVPAVRAVIAALDALLGLEEVVMSEAQAPAD